MTRKENVANGKRRPLGLESPERPCLFRFTVVKPEHLNSLVLSGLEFLKVRVAHSNHSHFFAEENRVARASVRATYAARRALPKPQNQ
jgi:hypothetical protein